MKTKEKYSFSIKVHIALFNQTINLVFVVTYFSLGTVECFDNKTLRQDKDLSTDKGIVSYFQQVMNLRLDNEEE